jgi:hypothetical protein
MSKLDTSGLCKFIKLGSLIQMKKLNVEVQLDLINLASNGYKS